MNYDSDGSCAFIGLFCKVVIPTNVKNTYKMLLGREICSYIGVYFVYLIECILH